MQHAPATLRWTLDALCVTSSLQAPRQVIQTEPYSEWYDNPHDDPHDWGYGDVGTPVRVDPLFKIAPGWCTDYSADALMRRIK